MFRRWAMVLLASPFIGATAQSNRLAVTGRVLSAAGAPLVGAEVSVAVGDNPGATFGRVDASGAYRITVARGAASLLVTARMLGHAPQFRRVTVSAGDSIARVPEMRLVAIAAALPVVRTVAARPMPSREDYYANRLAGETSTTADMSSFLASDLTGDVTGNANLPLGMLPEVSLTTDARGGAPAFSVGGLASEQNRVTLNGADYRGTVPRGSSVVQMRTSTYDPASSASGGQTNRLFLGGTFLVRQEVHLSLESPAMQWAPRSAEHFGQRTSFPVISALKSGPAQWLARRYAVSGQVSRRSSGLSTLLSADPTTLRAGGIDPDSAHRLLAVLPNLGIQPSGLGRALRRTTTDGSLYARLDFTNAGFESGGSAPNGRGSYNGPYGDGAITYAVAGGSWTSSQGMLLSPAALPLYDDRFQSSSAVLQIVDSRPVRGVVLSEVRSTFIVERSATDPISNLPGATVRMYARSGGEALQSAIAQGAGTGSAHTTNSDWSWQTTSESQWSTVDSRHTLKAALEARIEHAKSDRGATLGTFSFNSLEDFAASRPASFSRTFASPSTNVTALRGAVGIGDKFRPTRNFGVQFGLRAEWSAFDAHVGPNSRLDSLFGVRSATVPSVTSLAPMAGFTWHLGPRSDGYAASSTSLTGGIRDYRGLLNVRSLEPFARETGLAGAGLQLLCIGDVVPVPAWNSYGESLDAIPTRCADGSATSVFVESGAPVNVIAEDLSPSHSWRADLRYQKKLTASTLIALSGTSATNLNQPGWTDLNFTGSAQFVLAGEGGRPVFVPSQGIVPATGALSTAGSRRFSTYTQVMQRRSDLRSRAQSITATLDYQPLVWRDGSRTLLPLYVAYTLSDTRAQANGFTASTAGDPRETEWEPEGFSRHSLRLSTFIRVPDVAIISVGVHARSGEAFTPLVNGDINGDGRVNDRAFVFDPLHAPDSALASGMSALLGASSAASSCLRGQVGSVARQRSCRGPATAMMNATITIDPALTRLYNRGSVRVLLTNVLSGADQLLHGGNTRGWGQPAFPDRTLLSVRGFDAASRRFFYTVNPEFGTTTRYRNAYGIPFRITLDVKLELAPDRERAFLAGRLAPMRDERPMPVDSSMLLARLKQSVPPLFDRVLGPADPLALSAAQRTALADADRRHTLLRDSVYGAFVGYVLSHPAEIGDEAVQQRFHDAVSAVRRSQWRAGEALWSLLTPAQSELLAGGSLIVPTILWLRMDEKQLERDLRRWQAFAY